MESVIDNEGIETVRRVDWFDAIRRPEWVALGYFVYVAALGLIWPLTFWQSAALCVAPAALVALWRLERVFSRPWSRALRLWSSPVLILAGYWAMGLFAGAPHARWQAAWAGWDRALLGTAGLQRLVESAGPLLPALLETLYFALYAVPFLALAAIYWGGARSRSGLFLTILFLGAFSAYALLPHCQVLSPRVVFPGQDAPQYRGLARGVNTWLLDHLDIRTSVFPSGHVAVAFASAFGLFTVLRHRPWLWGAGFAVACTVYLATFYGRYHYAVDGLASIAVTTLAWRAAIWWERRA